jgi:hypothetical protein
MKNFRRNFFEILRILKTGIEYQINSMWRDCTRLEHEFYGFTE